MQSFARCVCEREREGHSAASCVCEREREGHSAASCVCVRDRERERERGGRVTAQHRVCVCACSRVLKCVYIIFIVLTFHFIYFSLFVSRFG